MSFTVQYHTFDPEQRSRIDDIIQSILGHARGRLLYLWAQYYIGTFPAVSRLQYYYLTMRFIHSDASFPKWYLGCPRMSEFLSLIVLTYSTSCISIVCGR